MNQKWLFPQSVAEALATQKELAEQAVLEDQFTKPITHIAGADISNTPFDPEQMIFAAIVILSYPSLEVVEIATHRAKQEFPYIPGLLGFREVPALVEAYSKLSIRPDVMVVDGHGISHPRKLGIASHLGVLLNIPTIGSAKSILIGQPAAPLPEAAGSHVPLQWKNEEIGVALRSKKRCSPIFLSSGHRIALPSAVELISTCLKGYRFPEPIRQAHIAANICRKEFQNQMEKKGGNG